MNSLEDIARQLLQYDELVLLGHAIPDGDCIGSMLGLQLALHSLGKRVEMILADPVPVIYHYLPDWKSIKPPAALKRRSAAAVYLDCSDQCRVDIEVRDALQQAAVTFNIDHHMGNSLFGDYNFVNPQAAATAEIIFELLGYMPVQITADLADCLLAAIIMDTGSFLNSNTTSTTMKIAAQLLELGASVEKARNHLFESKPLQEVLVLQQALQHLSLSQDGRVAWMSLSYAEAQRAGALDYHPEGIINYTRMIAGVEVGLLFREVGPGKIKVGFRSRGSIDVASLAGEFGGGGHRLAAGASFDGSLEEVRDQVLARVKDVFR